MYKIHLGCLPASCSREQLLSYFGQFGRFRDAKVTRKSKALCSGDGWLICEDLASYDRVLKIKNFEFAGRTIFCEPMLTGEQLQEKNRLLSLRRIFVSNLPPHMEDHQIFEVFSQFGEVQNAYRIISLKNEKRPFGFVTFINQHSAVQAVQSSKVYFEQRPIYISDFKKHKPDFPVSQTQISSQGHLEYPKDEQKSPSQKKSRALESLQYLDLEEDQVPEQQDPAKYQEKTRSLGTVGCTKQAAKPLGSSTVSSVQKLKPTKGQHRSITSINGLKPDRSAAILSTVGSFNNVPFKSAVDLKIIVSVQQDVKPTSKSYFKQRGDNFLSANCQHRESELAFQLSAPRTMARPTASALSQSIHLPTARPSVQTSGPVAARH